MALINILIVAALLGGEAMDGYAPRYAPGLMERVAHNRRMAVVPCMVSSPYYGLGTWVYVWSATKKVLRHCRVTDVSHPRDRERHIRTKRIVELSYEMAIELCGHEHLADPPTKCPVVVVRINEAAWQDDALSAAELGAITAAQRIARQAQTETRTAALARIVRRLLITQGLDQ